MGGAHKVLIRRVWLGHAQSDLIEAQRAVYESYAARARSFGEDQTIGTDDPEEMVARLAAVMGEVGADALNLRVQLPGMPPEQVREQIERIGASVVTPLKRVWPVGKLAIAELANRRPSASEMVPAVDVERNSGDLPRVVREQEQTAAAMSSASVSRPSGRADPAAAPMSIARRTASPSSVPARG